MDANLRTEGVRSRYSASTTGSIKDSEAVNQVTSDINADEVRATLTARLLAGAPPSTFQANAGADLLRWTAMDTTESALPSASRIAPLDDLFERTGLDRRASGRALQGPAAGPQRLPYAVPLNIHRLNLIYYNTHALDTYTRRGACGSVVPGSGAALPDERRRCGSTIPTNKLELKIAVGTKDSFTLTLFAFENVLPAVAGADTVQRRDRRHAVRRTLSRQLAGSRVARAGTSRVAMRAILVSLVPPQRAT